MLEIMKAKPGRVQLLLLCGVLLRALTCEAQPVIKITSSQRHCLLIKSDGSLWVKGYNGDGQLGNGTYDSVGTYNRLGNPGGALAIYGGPEKIAASGVTAVAVGINRSFFLKSDGSMWGMGNGPLGNGTYNSTNRPVQIVP